MNLSFVWDKVSEGKYHVYDFKGCTDLLAEVVFYDPKEKRSNTDIVKITMVKRKELHPNPSEINEQMVIIDGVENFYTRDNLIKLQPFIEQQLEDVYTLKYPWQQEPLGNYCLKRPENKEVAEKILFFIYQKGINAPIGKVFQIGNNIVSTEIYTYLDDFGDVTFLKHFEKYNSPKDTEKFASKETKIEIAKFARMCVEYMVDHNSSLYRKDKKDEDSAVENTDKEHKFKYISVPVPVSTKVQQLKIVEMKNEEVPFAGGQVKNRYAIILEEE